jgi:hypothetical protein
LLIIGAGNERRGLRSVALRRALIGFPAALAAFAARLVLAFGRN